MLQFNVLIKFRGLRYDDFLIDDTIYSKISSEEGNKNKYQIVDGVNPDCLGFLHQCDHPGKEIITGSDPSLSI